MKRGLFIILFVIVLVFISGQQSCEPKVSIGNPNTCCKLSSGSNLNCINNIDQASCDFLYTQHISYYTQELYQTNLPNSCNDVSGCSTALSCKYQNNIYENGEKVCLTENSKIYQCNNGLWSEFKDCNIGPIIGCADSQTCINPSISFTKCSTGNCEAACTPICITCGGGDPDGCGGVCPAKADGTSCNGGGGTCSGGMCCVPLENVFGNVLMMHFNDVVPAVMHDSSPNKNDGVAPDCNAILTVPGKFGRAGSFDGVDDFVNAGGNSAFDYLSDSKFSVSFWVYPKSFSAYQGFITHSNSGSWTGWEIGFDITQKLRLVTDQSYAVLSSDNVPLNQWTHYVIVFDNLNVIIYKNGLYDNSGTVTSLSSINVPLVIGRLWSSTTGYYFNGSIDEVSVWNRALSADEVSGLYNGQVLTGSESGLVSVWHMDEPIWGGVVDSSVSGNAGTLCNSVASDLSGKSGSALSFDGVNDYIKFSNLNSLGFSGSSTVTLSAWIKLNSISDATQTIIERAIVCGNYGNYGLYISNRKAAVSFANANSAAGQKIATGINNIPPNTWTFVVGKIDGTNVKIYVNGILENSVPWSGTLWNDGNDQEMIGAIPSTCPSPALNYFSGSIDEVAIWNRALSDAEILSIYQTGGLLICSAG